MVAKTSDLVAFEAALLQALPSLDIGVPDLRYQQEPRGLLKGNARLVARPRSTPEVAVIVKCAAQHRIGVVPYGGGTGLVGGQIATDGDRCILVSLERMNKIREVDPQDNILIAEAGAILAEVQKAATDVDRLFPLSLASEGSCQIGGNLASNAGGINVLRYGNARDLCLGLEVVLPDGSIWNGLSRLRKDNRGFDLRNMLIGSEGALGIITAASLRLYPSASEKAAAFVAVPGPKAALALLALTQSHFGENLSAFELMNHTGADFLREKMPGVRQIFEPTPDWAVLMEISGGIGFRASVVLENLLADGFEHGLIADGVLSQSDQQRQDFWTFRESIPEANRLIGAINSHDVSVPLGRLPELITRGHAALAKLGDFQINCFGHLGDGNLHYNVFPRQGQSREAYAEKRDEIRANVYGLVHELGGSISAEHGIGRLKKDDLARYGDPVKLAMMRQIKVALDPKGIMNPGVLF